MLKAFDARVECVGIEKGWKGFMENITVPLNIAGTFLYTSRTNPFKSVQKAQADEEKERLKEKIAREMAGKFDELGIDALIAIGGDLK
jgi:6-phosphofructokinase